MASAMSAGIVTAAPPNWVMDVTSLPAAVTPGSAAGFEVTVTNNGPSNISALYLNDSLTSVTPVYLVSQDRPGACGESGTVASGPLFCSFGSLVAGESVTIVVAYDTDGYSGSFPITFRANTTGATFSDGPKGRSHGDTLDKTVSTALSTNKNYAGLFSIAGGSAISNDSNLTGNNKQSTALLGLPPGVQASVEDGTGTSGSCTSTPTFNCNQTFGEWSVVTVGEGESFSTPFLVLIKYKTGVPTLFVHSFGTPVQQEIIGLCPGGVPPAIGDVPCFTWDAASTTATIYTLHNGSYKGR
jgi:uncharacterized repeat protein (TIGR01451 family)